ncbi:MAG: hypothetical protein ACI9TI_002414 [Natronomonas sp.]|jgi:hypothetical protein|uniref:hypothetical protein n=1 Tax=Natronomonas sp. TaxID=2184060 RepID=UPI003989D0BB
MPRDALLAPETKITLVFMFLGLTAWYLVGTVTESDLLELGALFGIGIVVPTLINELRRRSESESG